MRATICVDVENKDEVAAVDAWFRPWRARLTFISENEGCGCCVNLWRVDGPPEAVAEIPPATNTRDDWSCGRVG
jgi:hypothetical protein